MDRQTLRKVVEAGSIEWQRHALERMLARDVSREDVFEVLMSGEEIEDYPTDTPFPSALLLG